MFETLPNTHKPECRIECRQHGGLLLLLHKLGVHEDERLAMIEKFRELFIKNVGHSINTFKTPVIDGS